MGRGTTRRPKPRQRAAPSRFFLIALAIGVALLVWMFSQVIRKPPTRHGANVTPVTTALVPTRNM